MFSKAKIRFSFLFCAAVGDAAHQQRESKEEKGA